MMILDKVELLTRKLQSFRENIHCELDMRFVDEIRGKF